ncbi:uncharacterized protein LOC134203809 [Armigeres subalbatus]|uniref:uncharacterized protein LOC134203809 n=1 Tax=Armigeres subalbatus TaxID=124917 RepID=UPI002ED22CBC
MDVNGVIKTLGLLWDPVEDEFLFRVPALAITSRVPTKREVLSEIAKLFDPLGILGPIVVLAKLVMQQLWWKKLDWDDAISSEEFEIWSKLRKELCEINNMKIPRCVAVNDPVAFELHGFSDASQRAYVGSPWEMTIPRLELCAAVFLAKQMKTVREALNLTLRRVVLRSDSEIVLCWLKKLNSSLPVFVRNRVVKILELTSDVEWKHVRTKDNPADLVSRGVQPLELMKSELWWNGPMFLTILKEVETQNLEEVDIDSNVNSVSEEMVAVVVHDHRLYDVIQNCSDYRKMQRVFGYVIRFIHNCRVKRLGVDRRSGNLSGLDYRASMLTMVKVVQNVVYEEEIKDINRGQPVKGKLRNLNPIYDKSEGVLRVGGRIRHSDLPRDQKHPMILPEKSPFTDMKCVRCFCSKPKKVVQFMGDLPSVRVTAAEPFSRTGVDYAGPLLLKEGRGRAPRKAFICVFVCMCTRAIHLELVSSLSTDGFLGALHRFVSRRGNVAEMRSDNGTNFVGAERQLTELKDLLVSQTLENKISEFCQPRGITWKFIPPRAPHQGGLWEAGVKSVKGHLNKVLNESHLTYEEMFPQSDDPMDYQALSPGHFLVGRELTAIAEPNYGDLKESKLSRYQLIQRRKQAFWRRWSAEYVTGLKRRGKWYKTRHFCAKTWKLGRIVATHPGKDGNVRVVTVRTNSGTYKRATTKIAVLPIDEEDHLE